MRSPKPFPTLLPAHALRETGPASGSPREIRPTLPFGKKILHGLLRRLSRLGLHIELFFVVREGEAGGVSTMVLPRLTCGFLRADDIPELIRLEPDAVPADLREWFGTGRLCFGVKDNQRLIAKMWCDLREFSFPPNRGVLEQHEAYLFAAYADPEYRGQGLASHMRNACYQALRERGKSTFYSYTDFFNVAARRFKSNIGAKDEALRMHIRLGKRAGITLTLRRLENDGFPLMVHRR